MTHGGAISLGVIAIDWSPEYFVVLAQRVSEHCFPALAFIKLRPCQPVVRQEQRQDPQLQRGAGERQEPQPQRGAARQTP